MHFPALRLALVAVALSAPLVVSAAELGRISIGSIPAHELNYSPTFGGYSGDLTLVSQRMTPSRKLTPRFVETTTPVSVGSLAPSTANLTLTSNPRVQRAAQAFSNAVERNFLENPSDSELAAARAQLIAAAEKLTRLQAEREAAVALARRKASSDATRSIQSVEAVRPPAARP